MDRVIPIASAVDIVAETMLRAHMAQLAPCRNALVAQAIGIVSNNSREQVVAAEDFESNFPENPDHYFKEFSANHANQELLTNVIYIEGVDRDMPNDENVGAMQRLIFTASQNNEDCSLEYSAVDDEDDDAGDNDDEIEYTETRCWMFGNYLCLHVVASMGAYDDNDCNASGEFTIAYSKNPRVLRAFIENRLSNHPGQAEKGMHRLDEIFGVGSSQLEPTSLPSRAGICP